MSVVLGGSLKYAFAVWKYMAGQNILKHMKLKTQTKVLFTSERTRITLDRERLSIYQR